MYTPAQFREERPEILADAVRAIQLAALVTTAPEGLIVSHLPMVLKEHPEGWALEGHLARPNGHWRAALAPTPSVAIFQGPQAYVSPSWYESKRQHGKVVPTWNYIAVHGHGALLANEDDAWLARHLDDLTRANEAGRPAPWEVSDAPADFIGKLSRGIVGLTLTLSRLEGAWKLIQHRQDGDRAGAIEGLSASGDPGAQAVADAMRTAEARRERAPG